MYWVINIPFFISEVYKEKFAPRGRSRLDNCAKVSACKLRMPDTCVVVPTRYKSFLCKLLELKNRYYPIQFSQHFYFIILFLSKKPLIKDSIHLFCAAFNLPLFSYNVFAVDICRHFRIPVIYQKKMDGEWV